MADTWQKGNFGLSALSDVNRSFDELEQHFNDWLDGNFVNIAIPTDVSTSDIAIPSDETFTNIVVSDFTYSNVSIPTDATYTDINNPSDPTYDDIGVTT